MTNNAGGEEQEPVRALARQQAMLGRQQMAAFGHTEDPDHLDAAIRAWETILELSRALPLPEVVAVERAAESSYMMRWRLTHAPADLERVLAGREHLDARVSGPEETIMHQTLVAEALQARFDDNGNLADLEEATDRLRQALDVCTDDNPWRSVIEGQLSRHELTRHLMTNPQFTASVVAHPLLDEDDELDLKIRALGYLMRYQAGGPSSDAREAIALYERGIRVARDTEAAADLELSVGGTYSALFHRSGSPAALDEAITRYTRAVGALRDTDKFREGLRLLLNAHTTRTRSGPVATGFAEALDPAFRS